MFKEQRTGPPLLRLMYIAETQIIPPFTDVAFRRDSEEDGSGHVPPVPRPSAFCAPGSSNFRCLSLINRGKVSAHVRQRSAGD